MSLENASKNEALRESVIQTEENKRKAVMTILNLKHQRTRQKKMAIKFAREEMQRSPGDTASPEVQAAIATIKIHYGMQQVKTCQR